MAEEDPKHPYGGPDPLGGCLQFVLILGVIGVSLWLVLTFQML